MMKIGIGTYSFGGIASYLGLGPTLLEKFKSARALGFDSVELLPADFDNDVEDINKWLAETGLTVTSVHAEPTEEMVKKLAAVGGQAVIWAGTAFCNAAEAIEVAKQLDEMAEMARPYGIKVGYHNHSQEFFFSEGKCLLEHVLDNSSKCFFQLDCGWAQSGGTYPPSFIRKYKNRILAIHVKESSKVLGPGERPVSRHAQQGPGLRDSLLKAQALPLEQRQEMLGKFEAMMEEMSSSLDKQCKMGAQESNMNWGEIKKALDEQDFEAFWVVEREDFYDEHDKCLAEDCAWLRANIT